METIGIIGVGRMGSAMSRNIQKAGYSMVVRDAREEATRSLLEERVESARIHLT